MNILIAAITLFSMIRLISFAAWNVKKQKNIMAAVGITILNIGLIGCLIMQIYKICI